MFYDLRMLLSKTIQEKISKTIEEEFKINVEYDEIHVEHPQNETFGDFSSNVAFTLSKSLKQSPSDIAKKLVYGIMKNPPTFNVNETNHDVFEKIEAVDPGFVNFTLSSEFLVAEVSKDSSFNTVLEKNSKIGPFRGKKVLIEYTDPNPFKEFHIGHVMTNTIGESLARLIKFSGGEIYKVNYQGDVGMHVAKAVWGLIEKMKEEGAALTDLEQKNTQEKAIYLGQAYAKGAAAYKNDEKVIEEIKDINYYVFLAAQKLLVEQGWEKRVDYKQFISNFSQEKYEEVTSIYQKGRQWSLDYFEALYDKLGTEFDTYYFESKVSEYGLGIIDEGLKQGIFTEDDGAIIFKGDKYGLHTRVFVNSQKLPTYEAKDLGLAKLKNEDYSYDLSYIVTNDEVAEYFKVVLKALSLLEKDLASKTIHVPHGNMVLTSGKMSSRTGDVVSALELIDDTKSKIYAQMEVSKKSKNKNDVNSDKIAEDLSIGAIKYDILKYGIGKDITYDSAAASSILGNTGPYIQYTRARASTVIEKAGNHVYKYEDVKLDDAEAVVLRHLVKLNEVVFRSADEVSPNHVCEYLFELASKFNTFYNDLPILNAESDVKKNLRLHITKQVSDTLNIGLWLLGIKAPDKV